MSKLKTQDFRVFFTFADGGKGSIVLRDQRGHVAAAEKTDEVLALVRGLEGEGWRVTKVRPLKQMTPAQAVAEAAVV